VMFLCLFLAFQQVQVHAKWNLYASSIAFLSWKVLPVLYIGRFHTSPYLVFYVLKIFGISLHEFIDLVLRFSKNPSLRKSESECKRYHVFREGSFLFPAQFNRA
jgi:hypothetical protein